MAAGDKVYIADKQTLDDVDSKVGQTGNTGGTASAGTVFGKLNAIISSIATHVANWTAARAAKVDNLDTTVSSRQSEANAVSRYNTLNTNTGVNNTASATGTLSQKLSHIINLFSTAGQKTLVSKAVTINIASAGTHTLVNVTGGGQFVLASVSNMGNAAAPLIVTVDGIPYEIKDLSDHGYILQSLRNYGKIWSVHSNSYTLEEIGALVHPIYFKNSLVITVNSPSEYARTFSANYAVYE